MLIVVMRDGELAPALRVDVTLECAFSTHSCLMGDCMFQVDVRLFCGRRRGLVWSSGRGCAGSVGSAGWEKLGDELWTKAGYYCAPSNPA